MAREVRKIGANYEVIVKTSTFQQAAKWLVKRAQYLDPKAEYGIFRVERFGKRVEVELEATFGGI